MSEVPETPPAVDPVLARLAAVIDTIREIRARRWLDQYPPGHPERPTQVPDYVRYYERRMETR